MFSSRMPGAVYCGEGAIEQLSILCAGAKKAAVFSDRGVMQSGVLDKPMQVLGAAGIRTELLCDLPAEPDYHQAQAAAGRFRDCGADLIIGIGGGSVMDIAKLCSITASGQCTVRELIQNPGLGRKTVRSIMIPTTAGTGAEATPNAIVAVPEDAMKVGIVCDELIPSAVILDGEMIRHLPRGIAASTGVDALCHAIECFTSRKATPFSNLYALEAIKLIFANIEKACLDSQAIESKNAMLLAAFYGGAAITCSGTTAVHALSYPLGGMFHVPHGVANAMLLLPVMRFNAANCREELSVIYGALGQVGAQSDGEKAEWVLREIDRIVHALSITDCLQKYGIGEDDLNRLVEGAMSVQRLLQNNKRPVAPEDARHLYRQLLA